MRNVRTRTLLAATIVGAGLLAIPAVTSASPSSTTVTATLTPLNHSSVHGKATVTVTGTQLTASIDAAGLLAGAPHAAHIHFGATALHECPNRKAAGADRQLATLEGLPFYGPVVVAFTTVGDTSPASVLAVDRYSNAPGGILDYDRSDITTSATVADAIATGEGVLVIHGVDYNRNGVYDFDAGISDLNGAFPAEATDLAACGVLND